MTNHGLVTFPHLTPGCLLRRTRLPADLASFIHWDSSCRVHAVNPNQQTPKLLKRWYRCFVSKGMIRAKGKLTWVRSLILRSWAAHLACSASPPNADTIPGSVNHTAHSNTVDFTPPYPPHEINGLQLTQYPPPHRPTAPQEWVCQMPHSSLTDLNRLNSILESGIQWPPRWRPALPQQTGG